MRDRRSELDLAIGIPPRLGACSALAAGLEGEFTAVGRGVWRQL